MKKKTAFLIVLLVLTAIPTVPLFVWLFLITRVILISSGNVEIFQYNDTLVIKGQRGWLYAVEVHGLFAFIGSFISCIISFVSLFLLIRGWLTERRKRIQPAKSRQVIRLQNRRHSGVNCKDEFDACAVLQEPLSHSRLREVMSFGEK